MSTVPVRRVRVKPIRTASLTPPSSSGERILTLTEGEGDKAKQAHYYLSATRCDFGRGFRLEKFGVEGGTVYHVCLSASGNTCDCLGHLRWGHRTVCKHVSALLALQGHI